MRLQREELPDVGEKHAQMHDFAQIGVHHRQRLLDAPERHQRLQNGRIRGRCRAFLQAAPATRRQVGEGGMFDLEAGIGRQRRTGESGRQRQDRRRAQPAAAVVVRRQREVEAVDLLLEDDREVDVEPAAGDDATQSFRQKRLVTIAVPETIADGARTPSLGEITFPLVMRYVDDMLTVTDDELKRAMFYLWERMKIVVEPTGALAYAALHARKLQPSGRVGVVLSGGNVDFAQISKA